MAAFCGTVRLRSLNDWAAVHPRRQWKRGASAYELARRWQRSVPPSVTRALESFGPPLAGFHAEAVFVEWPTTLDTPKSPSSSDLLVIGVLPSGGRAVMVVEGRAKESFGPSIETWIRDGGAAPTPSRRARLDFLEETLRLRLGSDSPIAYQLVHRTAAALLEASKAQAEAAILLVHAFSEDNADAWSDFRRFLRSLGLPHEPAKDAIHRIDRPNAVHIPLFIGWIQDGPRADATQDTIDRLREFRRGHSLNGVTIRTSSTRVAGLDTVRARLLHDDGVVLRRRDERSSGDDPGTAARRSRVPPIWPLEVANVLVVAERRGRFGPDESDTFVDLLGALPITVVERASSRGLTQVRGLARTHQLSAYDAAYIDLAIDMNIPLATLDRKLAERAAAIPSLQMLP